MTNQTKRKPTNNNNIVSPIVAETPPETETRPFGFSHENSPLYNQIIREMSSKINALKNNQLSIVCLEEKFYEELHLLGICICFFYIFLLMLSVPDFTVLPGTFIIIFQIAS